MEGGPEEPQTPKKKPRRMRAIQWMLKTRWRGRHAIGKLGRHRLLVALLIFGALSGVSFVVSYSAMSYPGYYTAQFEFFPVTWNATRIFVQAYFVADGPIAVGNSLDLRMVSVSADLPHNTTRIMIRIYGWPDMNKSIRPSPGVFTLYPLRGSGNHTFYKDGPANLTAYMNLLSGNKVTGWGYTEDYTKGGLVISPATAWEQYESFRLTVSAAIASFVFAGVPTGVKTIRDLARPRRPD